MGEMVKITIQGMKGTNVSSMGTTSAEYIHAIPSLKITDEYIPVENQTYTRISGRKETYRIILVKAQENEKLVSLTMIGEKLA